MKAVSLNPLHSLTCICKVKLCPFDYLPLLGEIMGFLHLLFSSGLPVDISVDSCTVAASHICFLCQQSSWERRWELLGFQGVGECRGHFSILALLPMYDSELGCFSGSWLLGMGKHGHTIWWSSQTTKHDGGGNMMLVLLNLVVVFSISCSQSH